MPTDGPGAFRFASPGRLEAELAGQGFAVECAEELDVTVVEVAEARDLVDWVRAFGLDRYVRDLPTDVQEAWAAELVREVLRLNGGAGYRLGGVTRLVVARAEE